MSRSKKPCCCLFPVVLVLVTAASAYIYGGSIIRTQVQRAVEAKLPEKIGPASSYTVNVHGGLLQFVQGKVGSLDIHGEGVRLKSGLLLRTLDATLTGIGFDRATRTISEAGQATFRASIGQQQMDQFLTKKYPNIAESGVVLHDGSLTLAAKPELAGFQLRVKADAALSIEDDRRLILGVQRVTAQGLPVPSVAGGYLEDKLNPILDANDWGLGARLTSVTTTPDAITLQGNLNLANAMP